MASISIRVDDRNVKRRLNRLEKSIKKGSRTSAARVGRWTRDNIKLNMPMKTGESRRSIISVIRKDVEEKTIAVVTQSYIPHPDKLPWKGKIFNLPRWMFESPRALKHRWRSGSISKMRRVPIMAGKRFVQEVEMVLLKATK